MPPTPACVNSASEAATRTMPEISERRAPKRMISGSAYRTESVAMISVAGRNASPIWSGS